MSAHTPSTTDVTTRDRLLLAFAELGMYGIEARPALAGDAAGARAGLTALLAARAPHGLGSYAFWLRADEDASHAGLPLHTSGPEVDRAVVAALAHHGLAARPGAPGTVVLVS